MPSRTHRKSTPDEEYSPERKADLIDNIPSCTAVVSDVFDELTSDKRIELRQKVADVVGEPYGLLEAILDVYRNELPGFAAKWKNLEAAEPAESRRAAL